MIPPHTYFTHLKSYMNDAYIVSGDAERRVVLTEKIFREVGREREVLRIDLVLPGPGMAVKLDREQTGSGGRKSRPPLFHFLDDTSKPWSKRCDFVVFYVNGRSFHADCIEFKLKSISADQIRDQLSAGENWIRSLKQIIKIYTGAERNIKVRKFVFGTNLQPDDFLDLNRQLKADPSIRYYHYDDVRGASLSTLANASELVI